MKSQIFIIFLVVTSVLAGCQNKSNTDNDTVEKPYFVSIDGLWQCTPETASKFPNGILETVIHISGDAYGDLNVKGCFLWDSRFYDYWDIKSSQYTDSTHQLKITDSMGHIYIGTIDHNKEKIMGFVYSKDPENSKPDDSLNFIRTEQQDTQRLFVPRSKSANGCIKYLYSRPEQINDGLQSGDIFNIISDTTALNHLIERIIKQEFGRLESILLIKDDKLLLEEYFYGYNRKQLHPIHSCTKSITSILLGMALDRNANVNIDQPVFDFFPQYDSLKTKDHEQITLRHVLTMTAGFAEEEGTFDNNEPDDRLASILGTPLASTPGQTFNYSNECSDLLGGVIFDLTGQQADVFARENLFPPLQITEYFWQTENGFPHCYSDLYLLPRDMAKIGMLVLNNGRWNGQQIVSSDWISKSTRPYVAESVYFDYGFQWWYRSGRNVPWWPHPVHGGVDEHDMVIARGFGGQYIIIINDLDMVLVITASDYNEENGMANQKVVMVIEALVPILQGEQVCNS